MNKVKKMLYSQKVAPYVFVLPFVISLLVFWLYPLISGIVMSFQDISFGGSQWVGLKHYQKLASDKFFKTAVFNSVEYMLLTLLLLIPIPMMLAVLMEAVLPKPKAYGSDHVHSGTYICSYFRYVIPTDVLRR